MITAARNKFGTAAVVIVAALVALGISNGWDGDCPAVEGPPVTVEVTQ